MINVAFSRVVDRMLIADPGLLRLRNALRSVLSCSVTGFIAVSWAFSPHYPITVAALAVLFAMIAPLFVRDASRSGWFTSLAILYLFACLSYVSAAALAPHPAAGDIGFLAVFFIGILCQACGPRALGSALISIVTFYLGLYLHPTRTDLAIALSLSLVAPAMITIAGRWLLPARPARTLRRAVGTVTLRASRLLAQFSQGSPVALDAQWSSLNEAALALEDHLSLLTPPEAFAIRERVVELEIAAGQCRFRADPAVASDATAQILRQSIERLSQMVRARPTSARPVSAASGSGPAMGASAVMGTIASAASTRGTTTSTASTASTPFARRFADFRSRLAWLHATRASAAAILAMMIGHSMSPERWFWAVISVFVVFLGTRSRADTIHRGLERVGGTIAGALVSAILAIWLHDTLAGMIAAMMICAFGWAYFILSSYSRGVFFITIIVGLIYAQLGFAIGPLVELRIEEVLVGCLVSFAVAFLVMPLSATRHIDARLLAVLRALRDTVQTCASPPLDDVSNAVASSTAIAAMRRLDRSWHDLRIALRPFQTQRVFVWNPGYERVTGSLLTCLHWTRMLIQHTDQTRDAASTRWSSEDAMASETATATERAASRTGIEVVNRQRLSSILSRLDGLIAHYQHTSPAAALVASGSAGGPFSGTDAGMSPMLAQLDGAVVQLVERLLMTANEKPRMRWAVR